jgi:uncharacterized membrane protein YfcA
VGSFLFRWLKSLGQVDVTIAIIDVLFLGGVGGLMLKEAIGALRQQRNPDGQPRRVRRHNALIAALPMKMRFPRSGVYVSPLAPFLVGAGVGVLTVIMGVGGGFIMVPAMIYLLGMPTKVVVGTSLFQIIFITGFTTVMHATTSFSVDMALALLLIIGGVIGAQIGAQVGLKLKAEQLRILLALLVLAVAAKIALDLLLQPAELYSLTPMRLP